MGGEGLVEQLNTAALVLDVDRHKLPLAALAV